MSVRLILDDEDYKQYVLNYDLLNKYIKKVEYYDNYKDKMMALKYYFGDYIIFSGWDLDFMRGKYKEKVEEIIKSFEREEMFTYIYPNYKNYLKSLDKTKYRVQMEQIARVIIKIDDAFNFSIRFRNKYQGEKIYKDLIEELKGQNIIETATPDIDNYFNDEVEIITEKGSELIKIHTPSKKGGRVGKAVGKSIGKAVGKALNYKFSLKIAPDIKFRTRKECFDYCCRFLGYNKAFRTFNNEYKQYVDRIV